MINDEPPLGWAPAQLGDIIELKYGKALPDRLRTGSGFPVYGSNGVVGHHDESLTNAETIVVGRKGSVGAVQYCEGPCSPIDTTYFIDQLHGLPAKYWFHFLRSLQLVDLNKATAVPGLNREDAYRLEILVPPPAEQKRIADKLEAVLGRVDACRARLDRVPDLLKRFRQSVLAAATSGQLTEDWRGENQEATPVSFGVCTDELPNSWREVRLSEVIRVTSGEAFKKSEYAPSGAKLLQIANVSFGRIIWDQQNFLPLSYLESHADLALKEGDILMALNRPILNGRIKVARLTKADLPAILYQRVGRFVFKGCECAVDADYFLNFLQSFGFIHGLNGKLRGSDQPYINPPEMLEARFPVPPEVEQAEIVRRVEALFALADRIEARLTAARAQVERLTPATLSKAFRGDLVPQDPNDEPASKLLERVRTIVSPGTKPKHRT